MEPARFPATDGHQVNKSGRHRHHHQGQGKFIFVSDVKRTPAASNANRLSQSPSQVAESNYSRVARNLMYKSGYQQGQGLGKGLKGRLTPVNVSKEMERIGTRFGLGYEETDQAPGKWPTLPTPEVEERKEQPPVWFKGSSSEALPTLEVMKSSWTVTGSQPTSMVCQDHFVSSTTLRKVLIGKNALDKMESRHLGFARKFSNPYESIKDGDIFLNRAAMKMANLDALTDYLFTDPRLSDGRPALQEHELLTFADICAGPGGFSQYVLWKKSWHSKGYGFTLKGEQDFRLDKFGENRRELFEPLYGLHNDGDIYKSANIVHFRDHVLRHTHGKGVAFCMADGGFEVAGKENLQEVLSARLYLCQFLMALTVLRVEGHFVCKLFDTFTPFSVGLIYLMHRAFKEVAIVKPVTSRPANSERYLICKWRRPDYRDFQKIQEYMWHMCRLFEDLPGTQTISSCVPHQVLENNQEFLQYIFQMNEQIGQLQVTALEKLQEYAAFSKDIRSIPQHQRDIFFDRIKQTQTDIKDKCLSKWGITTASRITSPTPEEMKATLLRISSKLCTSKELDQKQMHTMGSIENYHCFLLNATNRYILKSLGNGHTQKWNNCDKSWETIPNLRLEVPSDTILECEIVKELLGQGATQTSETAVHVCDALVLNGTDVSHKAFDKRQLLLRKFLKAFHRPTRMDSCVLRVKDMLKLTELCHSFDKIRRIQMKGGEEQSCYRFNDKRFFPMQGYMLFRSIRSPWTVRYNTRTRKKNYCNGEKTFVEMPPDCNASYTDCLDSRWTYRRINVSQKDLWTYIQRNTAQLP